jgi:CBS-domain-containing membrane protein
MRKKTLHHVRRWSQTVRSEFKDRWKNYLYQSAMATGVVVLVFFVLRTQNFVITASLGSTAFVVFAIPSSVTAQPRRVIGGHLIGLLCGFIATQIMGSTGLLPILGYAIAVGLSIYLMVALDFEHPPASGTALGIALSGISPSVALTVVVSSIVISLAHRFLRRFLKDLT